ncbi:MAG: hypothetical protein M1491_09165 [Deltaproteobacteria bacterium]|nr:hypothetical protein [Deltaproteobacteria bacterium]MCL5276800.1 hypothetical protein [Deltaproteobacteria bacterium]
MKNGDVKDLAQGYFYLGVLYWSLKRTRDENECFKISAEYAPSIIEAFNNAKSRVFTDSINKETEKGKEAAG